MALRIFEIFGKKLGNQNWRKLTETDLVRKLRFSRIRARRSVSGPKNRIFSNIGMWPLVGKRGTSGSRKKYFWPNLAFWVEIWGPKANLGTKKSNFFKHRHVTPRWKMWGFRITKKIFLAKSGLLGRNLGPKSYFLTKFFKKKFFFQKFFIFDLSDSESKKGQKNDENFFSILQGSDT